MRILLLHSCKALCVTTQNPATQNPATQNPATHSRRRRGRHCPDMHARDPLRASLAKPPMIERPAQYGSRALQDHCPMPGAVGAATNQTCTYMSPDMMIPNALLPNYPTAGARGLIMNISQARLGRS